MKTNYAGNMPIDNGMECALLVDTLQIIENVLANETIEERISVKKIGRVFERTSHKTDFLRQGDDEKKGKKSGRKNRR